MKKNKIINLDSFTWVKETDGLSLSAKGGWIEIYIYLSQCSTKGIHTASITSWAKIMRTTPEKADKIIKELLQNDVGTVDNTCFYVDNYVNNLAKTVDNSHDVVNNPETLHSKYSNARVTLMSRTLVNVEKKRILSAIRQRRFRSNARVTLMSRLRNAQVTHPNTTQNIDKSNSEINNAQKSDFPRNAEVTQNDISEVIHNHVTQANEIKFENNLNLNIMSNQKDNILENQVVTQEKIEKTQNINNNKYIYIYSSSVLQKPTPEEVENYARKIGFEIDGNYFCKHFEAKGWTVGTNNSPMVSWEAEIEKWMLNAKKNKTEKKQQSKKEIKNERLKNRICTTCLGKIEWHKDLKINLCISCNARYPNLKTP